MCSKVVQKCHRKQLNTKEFASSLRLFVLQLYSSLNLLTTEDDYSRHRYSAACYLLAQSTLKIGSVLAERVGQGKVGGCTSLGDSAWWLL